MKIGNIELKHGLVLAPMAGVTDKSYRALCIEHGAEYVVTEMISAKAVHYKDVKTNILASVEEKEHPCAIQIFGSEPDIMAESARVLLEKFRPDAIDINMGCPMQKITGNGEGSSLMRNPELAGEIIKAVVDAVDIPVTVKFRTGWDSESINAVEIALIAEKNGACAVCVHGRTKAQLYSGECDTETIKKVKQALSIPVIANGNIFSAKDALTLFEKTGCDGIAVARGSYGYPWIFDEIICALEGKPFTPPTDTEKLDCAINHAIAIVKDKGEHCGVLEMRKIMAWYTKGMTGSPAIRDKINRSTTLDEVVGILTATKKNL